MSTDQVQMSTIDDIVTVFVRTESETENPRAAAAAARMVISNLILLQSELEIILEDHARTGELRPMPAINIITAYITLDAAGMSVIDTIKDVAAKLPALRDAVHEVADRWTNTANNMAELNAMTLDLGL